MAKGLVKVSANSLTQQALYILKLKGYKAWRQNNAAVYDPTRKVFRSNSATPGISDILGFNRNTAVMVVVEIKAGKDRLSEEQRRFLDDVAAAGGLAFVIRTTDDIEQMAKQL